MQKMYYAKNVLDGGVLKTKNVLDEKC